MGGAAKSVGRFVSKAIPKEIKKAIPNEIAKAVPKEIAGAVPLLGPILVAKNYDAAVASAQKAADSAAATQATADPDVVVQSTMAGGVPQSTGMKSNIDSAIPIISSPIAPTLNYSTGSAPTSSAPVSMTQVTGPSQYGTTAGYTPVNQANPAAIAQAQQQQQQAVKPANSASGFTLPNTQGLTFGGS
jgi:hypothetical protein